MERLGGFYILKHHKEFQYVYKKAKNSHTSGAIIFFLPSKGIKRVGFTATKKIGNAVFRNRAKRRLRSLFLEYSKIINDGTYVFVAKQSIDEVVYQTLSDEFAKSFGFLKAIRKNEDV